MGGVTAYNALWDQVDELAAELLASPGWQKSASPAGYRRAAEQYLASRADGYPAPAGLWDELYRRAQKILKGGSALFLRCAARPRGG